MRTAPTLALLCVLLVAPAAATHAPPHGSIAVAPICDGVFAHLCVTCDFNSEPCRLSSPSGCVPNTVEPRNMRPSSTVNNCAPPLPSREELPEQGEPLPVWPGSDDYQPVLNTLDALWQKYATSGGVDILP